MQMPDELLRAVVEFELPPAGRYGVLMCFLPTDEGPRARLCRAARDDRSRRGPAGPRLARGARCDPEQTGEVAGACRPDIRQLFVGAGPAEHGRPGRLRAQAVRDPPDLRADRARARPLRHLELLAHDQLQGHADQLPAGRLLSDLRDERTKSALALVHSRFSTNTFPSWELAHPYRVICHNGEINTVMGNVNWMRARESELSSELFGEDLKKILPVVSPGNSDSATFDNVLELLMLAGRTLPHAAMMMIPEAYRDRDDLPGLPEGLLRLPLVPDGAVGRPRVGRLHRRAGRRRDARPQRPAPRALGRDHRRPRRARLRVRPARGGTARGQAPRAPAAGEAVPRRPRARAHRRGRGGQARGRRPPALRRVVRAQRRAVRRAAAVERSDAVRPADARCASGPSATPRRTCASCSRRWRSTAAEPIGSMGNDLSLAVLSDQAPPLFSYFKQLFAQVTNPPIDPIREEIVMSLATTLGNERNLFDETPEHAHKLLLEPADPAQPRARDAAPRRARRLRRAHDRHHLADRRGPRRDERGDRRASAARRARRSPKASTSSSSPTGCWARAAPRSPRCWPSPPSTTTWCCRARGCAPGSSSSPASRARCTTSRR